METAVINGKTYTKEEIIQIGKEHFEAAERLRKYGIFIAALGVGLLVVSLVFFVLLSNSVIEFESWKEGVIIAAAIMTGLIAGGICTILGAFIIFLSFTKSDEKEYIKAGVTYLNKQAYEEQK